MTARSCGKIAISRYLAYPRPSTVRPNTKLKYVGGPTILAGRKTRSRVMGAKFALVSALLTTS